VNKHSNFGRSGFMSSAQKTYDIETRAGRSVLRFLDHEGQNMMLVADEKGKDHGVPVKNGVIPEEVAIRGLGPVELTVKDAGPTAAVRDRYSRLS
jgi:glyoxalase family protein